MNNLTRALFSITVVIVLSCIPLGPVPEVIGKSHPLPHVSAKMENPEFWINKVHNPTFQLMKPDQIQKLNDENLKKQGFYLCQVKDLKEEWTREELIELLNEDWQGFGETSEVRFGRNGNPLNGAFWRELKKNINEDEIKPRNQMSFGLIVKRADIRVLPTEEPSLSSPGNNEFDRFQHSMISPGTLVGIYHFSKDRRWLYLQTPFIRGWVGKDAVAIGSEKKAAIQYEEAKERLVVTGSYLTLFSDSSLQKDPLVAQMGASFPLVLPPRSNGSDGQHYYIVKVPYREKEGQLAFRNSHVSKREDVHLGFLPYTQVNVAKQAFKMLHQPYGWGEMFGGRDCSRFIMDIFAAFGILMPRNSKYQAQVGTDLGQVEGKTSRERQRILDRAPLAATLRLPGHIMLYLGKDRGRYYVIHSIYGFQKKGKSGPTLEKIGGVTVSDLSLGGKGPNGSLLDRLTDIRFIGEEMDSEKPQVTP